MTSTTSEGHGPAPPTSVAGRLSSLHAALAASADLACVLSGAAFVEDALRRLLRNRLVAGPVADGLLDPDAGAIGGMAGMADLAFAIGLLPDAVRADVRTIAQVREAVGRLPAPPGLGGSLVTRLCREFRPHDGRSNSDARRQTTREQFCGAVVYNFLFLATQAERVESLREAG